MNNKEKRFREMSGREHEFCDLLIFRSNWEWFRCGKPVHISKPSISGHFQGTNKSSTLGLKFVFY